MNHAKIAAALHALADAFLADIESVEQAVTGKGKGKGGKATPADPTVVAASAPVAPTAAVAAPAPVEPAAPPAPTVTKAQLNALVLKVAAKDRNVAEAILSKLGHKNTVTLPAELWQAAYNAVEGGVAKIDAAAVQVAQASLV